jgi:branched-chain amino acid transport system substrate-binding protein
MTITKKGWLAGAMAAGALALPGLQAQAQDKEVIIGVHCDRTGATQIVGTVICPAQHDYYALINSQGGVEGFKIKAMEIDSEYKVPPAIEAHQKFKKEGAISTALYATPAVMALTKTLEEDKILGTSPGFGTSAGADGKRFPYIFPIAASYWSQGAGAVDFAKKQLGGDLKGKQIAYLYLDNPAGK